MTTPFFLSRESKVLPGERRVLTNLGVFGVGSPFYEVQGGKMARIVSLVAELAVLSGGTAGVPGIEAMYGGTPIASASVDGISTVNATTYLEFGLDGGIIGVSGAGLTGRGVVDWGWLDGGVQVEFMNSAASAGDEYTVQGLVVEEVWFANDDLGLDIELADIADYVSKQGGK